jgi:hypothetical protein
MQFNIRAKFNPKTIRSNMGTLNKHNHLDENDVNSTEKPWRTVRLYARKTSDNRFNRPL